MPLKPTTWNAVVVGSWNRAILSPRGIATRLFGLPAGQPVEVRVPLDGVSPLQVIHEGLVVVAGDDRLLVEAQTPDYEHLARASQLAERAVTSLPETPFQAAGFNVRFEVDPIPAPALELYSCQATEGLLEAGIELGPTAHKWTIAAAPGQINLEVRQVDGTRWAIDMNFHRGASDVPALRQWLTTPKDIISERVQRTLLALKLAE